MTKWTLPALKSGLDIHDRMDLNLAHAAELKVIMSAAGWQYVGGSYPNPVEMNFVYGDLRAQLTIGITSKEDDREVQKP